MSVQSQDDFELLNIFAHDLKTPLGAVKSYIQLIESFGELNDRQTHYAKRAMVGVMRMESMIAELLDYASLGPDRSLDLVPCSIREMLDGVMVLLEDVAAHRNVEIHIDIADAISPALADAALLRHVFSNLISNAIKYNRKGGSVFVEAFNSGAYLRVNVRDTGIGIPPEALTHIFERFYRAGFEHEKVEGTGLGLAIVKTVVERHGGEVKVESVVGQGSTFSFTIPRVGGNESDFTHGSGEVLDDVDDNLQESREYTEGDSTSDGY